MSPIISMVLKRVGLGLISLILVSGIIFVSVLLLPGDLAQELLGQSATPASVAQMRRDLGLDQPPLLRYLSWLGGMLQGDFGRSLASQRPISELIGYRLGNTLFLAAFAASISVPLALTLGILASLYRDSWFDRGINVFTLASISFPEFFIAYILVFLLAIKSSILPGISNISDTMTLIERVVRTILPALTLTLVVTAHMMRMTRVAIINLLSLPYIEMARLKGASQARVIVVHALPNAIAPIATVVMLNLAYLITGVVVVESVFVYPGLGQLLVDSVSKRDVTVVQAACLIFASAYILLNLFADVVSIVSNPRLLHPK
jgi:peptide/nickel transport system permease protein